MGKGLPAAGQLGLREMQVVRRAKSKESCFHAIRMVCSYASYFCETETVACLKWKVSHLHERQTVCLRSWWDEEKEWSWDVT